MSIRHLSARSAAVTAAAAITIGAVAGTAYGLTNDNTPRRSPTPDYATNTRGLTYGSIGSGVAPEDYPDLILAQATNGKIGYIYATELDTATGGGVTNPAEALEWQRAHDNGQLIPAPIPVYDIDGVTQLGEFEISPTTLDKP